MGRTSNFKNPINDFISLINLSTHKRDKWNEGCMCDLGFPLCAAHFMQQCFGHTDFLQVVNVAGRTKMITVGYGYKYKSD